MYLYVGCGEISVCLFCYPTHWFDLLDRKYCVEMFNYFGLKRRARCHSKDWSLKNFGCSSKSESEGYYLILNPMKIPGHEKRVGNNVGGSNLNFSYFGMQQHKTRLLAKEACN